MYFKKSISLFLVSSFVFTCVIGRTARILDGDEAGPGQFPYAVAIFGSQRGYLCGGGIIGEKWILSAAHCVTDHEENDPFRIDDFSVIIGTNDFQNDLDSYSEIEIPVEAIYIPREYKLTIRRADIAVLKLAETLDYEKYHLQQLILAFGNQNFYNVGTHAVVSGFGASDVGFTINGTKKELTDIDIDGKLRHANVQIVSDTVFAKIPHDDFDLGEYHFLAKMMKQSNSSYGMCYGDSGSPVVYQSRIIIGVTVEMFDIACDGREYPSLYTKVAHYLKFIENAVSDDVTKDIRVKRFQL